MISKNYTHLTKVDIVDGEDIREIMKDMDPFAQQLILEHAKGMKLMQDIMEKKTA